MRSKRTLGKLSPDRFGMLDPPKLDMALIEGFLALPDLTGMTSDAMDDLGLAGVVPGSMLIPTDPSRRVVGRALTVENRRLTSSVAEAVREGRSRLGEIEAHNLAEPGDVLVILYLRGGSVRIGSSHPAIVVILILVWARGDERWTVRPLAGSRMRVFVPDSRTGRFKDAPAYRTGPSP